MGTPSHPPSRLAKTCIAPCSMAVFNLTLSPICPPPRRYISIEYTQPEYVQMAYMRGHEIATHTGGMGGGGAPGPSEVQWGW